MDGYDIRSNGYAYSDSTLFLELLPSSGIDYENHDPNNRDQKVSTLNDLGALYFQPEVEDIIGHVIEVIQAMGDNPNFEEIFSLVVGDQISVASRMIQEGILLEQWQADQNDAAETEKEALTTTRYERIMQEIASLGWEEHYFPTEYSPGTQEDLDQWMKYLFQAKEFTVRGWKAIRPKMEAIYLRSKELIRINILLDVIQDEFLARRSRLPIERRRQTPGWQDTLDDPRLDVFIEQTHATDWTADDICTFVDALLADTTDFFSRVQAQVAGKVAQFYVTPPPPSVLKESRVLFQCQKHKCSSMRTLIPFRDVIDHFVQAHPEEGWGDGSDFIIRPKIEAGVFLAATDVLRALGLEEDISYEEVEHMGKFACRCGHHLFCRPMAFEKLVFHVYLEQQWYKEKLGQVNLYRRHRADDILEDSHNLRCLRELVGHASAEEESAESSTDDDDDVSHPQYHGCQWCFSLTRRVDLSKLEHETVDYHMHVRTSVDARHDRLRLVIPPRNEKPVRVRLPPHKALGKRSIGALKLFLDLPLDIIFEVDGLPACPADLDEPEYASLLFDKFCMACASTRGIIKTDFRLRLRRCAGCMKTNTTSGFDVVNEWAFDPDLLKLFPASGCKYRAGQNQDQVVEMAREQICLASRIVEAGLAIEVWKTNEEHALEIAAKALAEARYGTIMERIKAPGWDPKWFPTGDMGDSEDFEAWNGYLHQPMQFNARGWDMIRPKAEAIYLRSKQRHQTRALLEAVVSVYKERRSALPLQQRREMPGCSDVVFDSRLEVFLSENRASDWTDGDTEAMATTLLSDSSEFRERLQQKLVKDF
ncbi:hypothetical protein NLJ89_g358 [Agrocybe chaxingu]|uniref:Uncharacterized protein n=1 Tax=Agrocybe chaxingu TaxID=84603 RepID=A0A9W8N243_9AGAR|nr:hypothetical protein NLJ89_g358 [Agrocybe chaxingu]